MTDPKTFQPASSTFRSYPPARRGRPRHQGPAGKHAEERTAGLLARVARNGGVYWKKRALSAEERMQLRLIEVAALQARVLELENEAAGKDQFV